MKQTCIRLSSELFEQLQQIAKLNSIEMGGFIERDGRFFLDKAAKSSNTHFLPSQQHRFKKGVIHFHTHPDKKFQTPPSDYDFIQMCLDYEIRDDSLPYHVVVCPQSTFVMSVPLSIRRQLDSENETTRAEGRKKVIEIAKKMKKFHVCYENESNKKCITRFIKKMDSEFGLKIAWICSKNRKHVLCPI
jgi:hypothetical protein